MSNEEIGVIVESIVAGMAPVVKKYCDTIIERKLSSLGIKKEPKLTEQVSKSMESFMFGDSFDNDSSPTEKVGKGLLNEYDAGADNNDTIKENYTPSYMSEAKANSIINSSIPGGDVDMATILKKAGGPGGIENMNIKTSNVDQIEMDNFFTKIGM